MIHESPRPIIFAHRGASLYAPENTLAAFELALRQGADAIELDAKLTGDGHVVVIHDQTVDRTTDGKGRVKELSLAEIRKLDAGSHFDITFRGEMVPTLEEVFKAIGQMTLINVELTNYASPFDDLPTRVATLVRRYKLSRRIIFSSFNPIALRRIHRLLPDIPVGLLAFSGGKGALARSPVGRWLVKYQTLNLAYQDITQGLVKNLHNHGRDVLVYTVNEEDEVRRQFDLDVDGIFTDDPPLAIQLRDQVSRKSSHSV